MGMLDALLGATPEAKKPRDMATDELLGAALDEIDRGDRAVYTNVATNHYARAAALLLLFEARR